MHYKATKLLYERKKQIIKRVEVLLAEKDNIDILLDDCLLYTSPSPRDRQKSRMPSSA